MRGMRGVKVIRVDPAQLKRRRVASAFND